MNSIDTFIPTLMPLLDSEKGTTALPAAAPDAAALEALRALMGGFAPPPATVGLGTAPPAAGPATSVKSPATPLPAVLEQLLKSDGLPASLVPLLATLRDNVEKGGAVTSDPALVAEIKTLLLPIASAKTGPDHPSVPTISVPIKAAALSHLALNGRPSAESVQTLLPTLPGSAIPGDGQTQPSALGAPLIRHLTQARDIMQGDGFPHTRDISQGGTFPQVRDTAQAHASSQARDGIPTDGFPQTHGLVQAGGFIPSGGMPRLIGQSLPAPVMADDISQSRTAPHAPAVMVQPTVERPPLSLVALPPHLPALAQALLHIIDTRPEAAPASVMMPSFANLIEDETTPSQERPADMPNLGSTILQSLGHQSTPAPSVQANDRATPASAVERVSEVSHLITQMADRVLVTDPLHGQTQEVRIKIADSVMQDTEVRVWREDGGALRVEFDTASAYWSRILNDASPLLSQRLNERLPSGTEAQVTVTVQQQGQQPEDGRSRNRHNPWELAQQTQDA